MTWYAHHLFAQPSEQVLDRLLGNPVVSKGVYWVRDISDHPWHAPEVIHGLPPGGLVVVRPICDPSAHCATWYKEPIISWFDVHGPKDVSIYVTPGQVWQDIPEADPKDYPPLPFLKYLKDLSEETNSTVAFYHCFTWGGDTEVEYSWVFLPDETVYYGIDFREFPNRVVEYRKRGGKTEKKTWVLVETLAHFSLRLPTPYFALHARSFPWEISKVDVKPYSRRS
jgi:hypothetical protein